MLKPSIGPLTTFLGQKVSFTLWHCRLGHPTNNIVQTTLSKSSIPYHSTLNPQTSISCLKGKFTKLPFPIHVSKSSIHFEVIHTDVWGPAFEMSLERFKYYVSFIDECIRYTWISPLINKDVVFGLFV